MSDAPPPKKKRYGPVYRVVAPKWWDEAWFRSFAATTKLVFFDIVTGRQTGPVPGLTRYSIAVAAESTGLSANTIRKALAEIAAAGAAIHDPVTRVVYVPAVLEVGAPDNPNVILSWRRAWSELPDCPPKRQARSDFERHCLARDGEKREFTVNMETLTGNVGVDVPPDVPPNHLALREQPTENRKQPTASPPAKAVTAAAAVVPSGTRETESDESDEQVIRRAIGGWSRRGEIKSVDAIVRRCVAVLAQHREKGGGATETRLAIDLATKQLAKDNRSIALVPNVFGDMLDPAAADRTEQDVDPGGAFLRFERRRSQLLLRQDAEEAAQRAQRAAEAAKWQAERVAQLRAERPDFPGTDAELFAADRDRKFAALAKVRPDFGQRPHKSSKSPMPVDPSG